jgi:HEAT repeat protein
MNSQDEIEELFRLLPEKNFKVWYEASDKLAAIGATVVPRLLELLVDSQNDLSIRAGMTLGKIKDRTIVPRLLELCHHSDLWVRRAALHVLGKTGDSQAMPTLIQLLNDPHAYIRDDTATALGDLKDPAAMPVLLEALHDSRGEFHFAGIALASFGEPALPYLIQAIRGGYAHEQMEGGMARIGKPAISALLEIMNDTDFDEYAVEKAASILGYIGDPVALPALSTAFYRERDDSYLPEASAELIGTVAIAIRSIRTPEAKQILLDALAHNDPMIRGMVTSAFTDSEDEEFINALIPLLSDTRPMYSKSTVSDMAAEALERIDTDEAHQALEEWRNNSQT